MIKVFWGLMVVALLAGCAAPRSAGVRPYSDNRAWVLLEDMDYQIGNSQFTIVVPKGFVTDYASVPQMLWGALSPHDNYSRAAVVHDYLYWTQICTRPQSDNIMQIAMKESEVPKWKQIAVYGAVSLLGQASWDENKEFRKQGLIRIIPDGTEPPGANETWDAHQLRLQKSGAKETPISANPEFCKIGNQANIPF